MDPDPDILRVVPINEHGTSPTGAYLILECGHWYKWTGPAAPPQRGGTFPCPNCRPVTLGRRKDDSI